MSDSRSVCTNKLFSFCFCFTFVALKWILTILWILKVNDSSFYWIWNCFFFSSLSVLWKKSNFSNMQTKWSAGCCYVCFCCLASVRFVVCVCKYMCEWWTCTRKILIVIRFFPPLKRICVPYFSNYCLWLTVISFIFLLLLPFFSFVCLFLLLVCCKLVWFVSR